MAILILLIALAAKRFWLLGNGIQFYCLSGHIYGCRNIQNRIILSEILSPSLLKSIFQAWVIA